MPRWPTSTFPAFGARCPSYYTLGQSAAGSVLPHGGRPQPSPTGLGAAKQCPRYCEPKRSPVASAALARSVRERRGDCLQTVAHLLSASTDLPRPHAYPSCESSSTAIGRSSDSPLLGGSDEWTI